MNIYRITLDGSRFQIIESCPDGRVSFNGRFVTEMDAQVWIDDHVRPQDRAKAEQHRD